MNNYAIKVYLEYPTYQELMLIGNINTVKAFKDDIPLVEFEYKEIPFAIKMFEQLYECIQKSEDFK